MDAANRRPQLPALTYLDVEKVKREEEAYQSRHTGASQTLPAVTAASPTFQYPPGPPPPYSQPQANSQTANIWPTAQAGVHTQPESRQTSGDEPDAKQTTRQSLPSISEALGVESQTSYQASAPVAALPPVSAHHSLPPSIAPTSPVSATKRTYTMDPPPAPQTTYATNGSYPSYSQLRQDSPAQSAYPAHEPSRPAYASDRPALQLQTSDSAARQPQQPSSFAYPPNTSSAYEHPPSQSAGSMGPTTFPYGYTPYPPRYAQPTPPSSVSTGPIYQPSANYPAPSTPSALRPDAARWGEDRSHGPGDYSASVKRHLELYDLEGALNEIAQASGMTLDFSRRYGDRLHHSARSGPTMSTMPGLVEVDDMITKSRWQVEALLKIREVVVAQQAAVEQQIADQRKHVAFSEPPPSEQDLDDAKIGFEGGDNKRKRGRAARPGRCHSCNRAETPEWRRGPDGARTLCNACGLHYAKLTRKQQGASKTTAVSSSNLRPKET